MSLLKNLKTDSSIAGEKDSLGGGFLFDSNIYNFIITMAYLKESDGGALGIFVTLKDKASGKDLRVSQYMTSGKAKGQKNTYQDKDGNEQYLPGFLFANSLAELSTGFPINELDTDEKVINIYNSQAKAEVPTKMPVITAMLNQEINAGVLRQLVNKQIKGDDGNYVDDPSGATREINEIDKFFCAKDKFLNMTSAEIRAKSDVAKFADDWKKKWEGQVQNRVNKTNGGTAGAPSKPGAPAAAAQGKPANSLFG